MKILKKSNTKLNVSTENSENMDLHDPSFEMIDPTPDIYALFQEFNKTFFYGKLDSVEVKWSKRMTSCAGICYFNHGYCSVRLSIPLLQYRPRSDLIDTLLVYIYYFFILLA